MASQRKAGALLGYANILTKNIVNLIYVPLLLHYIGQGDYGVYQMANSTVFALTLLSAGFYGAYIRFYMRAKEQGTDLDVRRLNGMYLLIYIVISVICVLAGVLLVINVDLLFSGGLTAKELVLARELFSIMIFNIAVQMMSIPFNSYIAALERFIYQQTRQLFTTLSLPLLAVVLLNFGSGAVGVAISQLVVNAVLLVMNINYALIKLKMRFTFSGMQAGLFKSLIVFSFWIFLNQIFDLVNNQVPNFLLGAMASSTVVAVFAIAVNIRYIFFSLSGTMASIFSPMINRIVATSDDNNELTRLMTRVGRYQMMLFWYAFGGFIVLGKYFIKLWAGDGFQDAYWLVLIMVLPIMIPLTQNTGIEIQRAKNRHQTRSIIYIFTAILDIIVSALLIPYIGYWATAIGYIFSIILGTGLFMNIYYQKRIGIDMLFFWKNQLGIILVSFVPIILGLVFTHFHPIDNIVMFFVVGIIYSLIYVVLLWLFALNRPDKEMVMKTFGRSIHSSKHAR